MHRTWQVKDVSMLLYILEFTSLDIINNNNYPDNNNLYYYILALCQVPYKLFTNITLFNPLKSAVS